MLRFIVCFLKRSGCRKMWTVPNDLRRPGRRDEDQGPSSGAVFLPCREGLSKQPLLAFTAMCAHMHNTVLYSVHLHRAAFLFLMFLRFLFCSWPSVCTWAARWSRTHPQPVLSLLALLFCTGLRIPPCECVVHLCIYSRIAMVADCASIFFLVSSCFTESQTHLYTCLIYITVTWNMSNTCGMSISINA